jgi:hypothetical protein
VLVILSNGRDRGNQLKQRHFDCTRPIAAVVRASGGEAGTTVNRLSAISGRSVPSFCIGKPPGFVLRLLVLLGDTRVPSMGQTPNMIPSLEAGHRITDRSGRFSSIYGEIEVERDPEIAISHVGPI